MGIKHETSSCYNPELNGLSERSVGVIKQMLKKTGPVKGRELEKLMFSLNAMSRESGAGAPLDHFLQRNVRSQLPNAANKMISFRKEIERRKAEQEKWIRKPRRGSCTAYQVGYQVWVQNQHTGQWSIKGSMAEVVEHDGGVSKT